MSAYVVDRAHIAALVRAALSLTGPSVTIRWFSEDPRAMVEASTSHEDYFRRLDAIRRELVRERGSVERACRLLTLANVASVKHKYPEDTDDTLPGPATYWTPETSPDWAALVSRARRLSPEEALAALDGYEYQSCEHPGWFGSEAWRLVQSLRDTFIRALPGYRAADTWSITDPVTA